MLSPAEFNNNKYVDTALSANDDLRVRLLVDLIGSGKKILDVGCGSGVIGSKLLQAGNEVYGVDISQSCVRQAKSVGVFAKVCDIEKEPIPFDDVFDVIFAGEVIEHLYDTGAFLDTLFNQLREGGKLILTTPNVASLGRRVLLLLGRNPHLEPSLEPPNAGHIRYFTKATLEELLRNHGFKAVEVFSDEVNFIASGKVKSRLLAKKFPTLGRTLIAVSTRE